MRKKKSTGRSGVIIASIAAMILMLMITPAGAAKPQLTDMSITDAVEDELRIDSAVPHYRIDVTTSHGIVTLKGPVDNILAKERAARIARIVKGVRAVVNEIEVVPPILGKDRQIGEDVEEALLNDPATDSYEVEVKVISADRDGKIRLSRRELLPFPEGREGEAARERIARAREGGPPQRSGGRGRDRNDRGGGRGRDRGPRSRNR